jgi:hypothetical protein
VRRRQEAPDAATDARVELEVTGEGGVRVVVRGPMSDAEQLERTVVRIVRDLHRAGGPTADQGRRPGAGVPGQARRGSARVARNALSRSPVSTDPLPPLESHMHPNQTVGVLRSMSPVAAIVSAE